jgi:hypothetical protein
MTQGSADAFAQGSVSTGIVPEEGIGLEVIGLEFVMPISLNTISADSEILWSLARDTKTAVVSFNDDDCITYDGRSFALTTSGTYEIHNSYRYAPVHGTFLVEPTIYGQVDSTSTGLTITAYWRIYYQEVKMSEVDILRVLNNS